MEKILNTLAIRSWGEAVCLWLGSSVLLIAFNVLAHDKKLVPAIAGALLAVGIIVACCFALSKLLEPDAEYSHKNDDKNSDVND